MAIQQFYLIGPGAVGKVLARRLVRAGWRCKGICSRGSAAGRKLARELDAPYVSSVSKIQFHQGTMLLAVGTGQVGPIATELARLKLDWTKIAAVHHSGSLDTSPLNPLARRGAGVGACHPFMTFPRFNGKVKAGSSEDLYDPQFPLYFGIDGNTVGISACRKIAKACKGKILVVRGRDRVAYHAAAVLACTLLGANLALAERVLMKVGISEKPARDAVLAIAQETLRNFAEYGMDRSWTGPAVRGDKRTVAAHVSAISKLDRDAARVYRVLSNWVLQHKRCA